MAAGKSKILIIGGTGYIGKHIVEASVEAGHQTFVLVREATLSAKSNIINNFKTLAVNFLIGDLEDHESLTNAIKQVDIVISAVGQTQILNQVNIINAIKQVGNIKRFLPSEFGLDVDRVTGVELLKIVLQDKVKIRRAIEAAGIPYTYVSSNNFAGYFLPNLNQFGATAPPREKVVIFGDGNPKAIFNKEEDIGKYTIKAVDDPRTLNKILYIKPPLNVYSFNDLVTLWEKKINITLERIYIPQEQLVNNIQEAEFPMNVIYAMAHSVFVKGDQTNFEIEPSVGVEASKLYPDVNYTTVDDYLNAFV
ncbi:Isoflavone reductase-like protein [Euphorbia peplus]|nr:Isoflavone reductase-like protein [Euphorbia peplus]